MPSSKRPPATGSRRWPALLKFTLLAGAAFGVSFGLTRLFRASPSSTPPSPGMVLIPGGEFQMGTAGEGSNGNEHPVRTVRVDAFWMDEHEVTNAQFREFVTATGYVSTAEVPPDWEEMKKTLPSGTPKPPPDKLQPGAVVFTPPSNHVPLNDASAWWRWVPGACWKHPEGPASHLDGRENHPVVQVSWEDAVAYAKWAGKRLPTEAEWEYAARGGHKGKRYEWGDDPPTENDKRANIWQGDFPVTNTRQDGFERTAPVKSYPANGHGLHDMAGNVWEWCSDWYRADEYARRANKGPVVNPSGPAEAWDPNHPLSPRRVTRGGSFLCHVSYCESYRTAARRGTEPDTGMSHIGFRCVISAVPR